MNDPGVGVVVTICTYMHLCSGNVPALGGSKTQSQAVRADMLHYQSDVMMNGLFLLRSVWLVWLASGRCVICVRDWYLYFIQRFCGWGMTRCNHCLTVRSPDSERDEIFYRDLTARRQWCSRSSNAAVGADPLYSDSHRNGDNLPLVQAHVIAEQVEQAILQRFPVQTSSFTGILLGCTRLCWAFVIRCKK